MLQGQPGGNSEPMGGDSTNQIGNHVGSVAKMSMDSKGGEQRQPRNGKSCPFRREVILEVKVEKMFGNCRQEGSHYGGRGE
jgi:hypothetical protein